MKPITLILCIIGIACFGANAQSMDSASMMKAWQSFMTPGDMQKMIAKADGMWTEEVSMWNAPNQPPQVSTATCSNKMVLNGLYQESIQKGSVMGMPFEGHGTLGYDNARKVFVSSWIDNMGSGIMYTEGTWDDGTHSIILKGKTTDPMTAKDEEVREVMKFVDDNHQVLEMYGKGPDGKEMKMMEIKLTRKK